MTPATRRFPVGSRVVRDPAGWRPSEFDAWGAGEGVGVVVEPPFPLLEDHVDVRWPTGRCFQHISELLPAAGDGPGPGEGRP